MPIDNLSKITSRSGINTTILLEAGNANVTGIITAAGFDGPFTGGGGNNAGIVTARGGLHVGAGGTIIHALSSNDGKVGIGSEIPTQLLDVAGTVKADDISVGGASITNPSGTALDFNGSITASDVITAGALLHEGNTNTLVHFSAPNIIDLKTGGTVRLTASNSGVSLQNSSTFNVNGGRLIVGDSTGITTNRIVLGNNDDLFLYHDSVNSYIENNTGKLRIIGNNTIQLGDETDQVGIGTSVPSAILEITKNAYNTPDNEDFFRIKLQNRGGTTNDVGIGQIATGNLAFNTTAGANYTFYNGTIGEVFRIEASGAGGGGVGISTNGGVITPDHNALLIRARSTVGTDKGHIMLTGDGATNNEGPQIVFSESGSGSNFVGGAIGFRRTGGNGVGDLVFGVRTVSGVATTPPTEIVRITSSKQIGIGSATMLADTKVFLYDTSTTNYRSLAIDSLATNGSTLIYKQKGTQVISIGSGGGNNLSGSDVTHGLIRSEVATVFAVGNSEKVRITSDGLLKLAGLTLSQRNSATGVDGGLIYNSEGKIFQYYDGSGWISLNTTNQIVATGGNSVATSSGYRIHTFTGAGTFVITSGLGEVEVLVVAGGGSEGGGNAGCHGGGGGGGGGVVYKKMNLSAGNYPISIGQGGTYRNNGGNTVFGNGTDHQITAVGGGAGGPTLTGDGNAGGSGGGGSRHTTTNQGGAAQQPGTTDGGFGNAGGNTGSNTSPGGGGGAGGAGTDGSNGGLGGAGKQFTQFGVTTYFGAGGNGNSSGGSAGQTQASTNGAANTGAGGGGSPGEGTRFSGGSGIVLIRYPAAS